GGGGGRAGGIWAGGNVPGWRAGADQPHVIQERPTESRREEVVRQRVILGIVRDRRGGGRDRRQRLIVVADGQGAGIAPGHELVHLSVVDRIDVLEELV